MIKLKNKEIKLTTQNKTLSMKNKEFINKEIKLNKTTNKKEIKLKTKLNKIGELING